MATTQTVASWVSKNLTFKRGNRAIQFTNNAHMSTLQKHFYNFYKTGKFCDVTICCQEITYPTHSVILAASCPYFDKELESGEEEIYLPKSVAAEGFEPVLEYLYTGNLAISEETFAKIKCAAQLLEIKSALIICDAYNKMSAQNKAHVTLKTVGKNDSEKSENDSSDDKIDNCEKKSNSTLVSGVPVNNIIPESLRSSLSVSVTSAAPAAKTTPTPATTAMKRLHSGLEIIPISGPTKAKQIKNNESSNQNAEKFNYAALDDLSDSEEYFSDEEGLSDFAEEEAMIREYEKSKAPKIASEEKRTESSEKNVDEPAEEDDK